MMPKVNQSGKYRLQGIVQVTPLQIFEEQKQPL